MLCEFKLRKVPYVIWYAFYFMRTYLMCCKSFRSY